jgi:hypothetical protein
LSPENSRPDALFSPISSEISVLFCRMDFAAISGVCRVPDSLGTAVVFYIQRNYIRNNKEKAVDPLRVGGLFGSRVRSGYGLSWAPDTPRVPVARGERDGLCDWPTRLALSAPNPAWRVWSRVDLRRGFVQREGRPDCVVFHGDAKFASCAVFVY